MALTLLASVAAATGVARGGNVANDAVFGKQGVSVDLSSTVNGVVASDGSIAVDSFSTFTGLTGGGSLNGNTLGDFTVNGPVTFNGNVSTGQYATINGPINSGGNVDVGVGASTQAITAAGNVSEDQSATTQGTIRAGGNFTNGVFGVATGNVGANGSVTVDGTVNGNVTFGTTLTIGTFGAIHGSTTQGTTTVNPATYTPTPLPPALMFTAGGPNVTSGGSASNPLAPGSYGALNIGTFGQLFLTAGTYEFTSFHFSGDTIHLLNVGPGNPINILVTGDVFEDTFSNVTVNGLSYSQANPSLASDIVIETLGNYSQNTLGSVNFFGTIFAPQGNVTIGQDSNLTGQIVAGGQVNIGVFFNQNFVPLSVFPVPEPNAFGMMAIGAAVVFSATRLRRRSAPGERE